MDKYTHDVIFYLGGDVVVNQAVAKETLYKFEAFFEKGDTSTLKLQSPDSEFMLIRSCDIKIMNVKPHKG